MIKSMAPGALSILAPFLRRKVKKYERLETEDPEKRSQISTQDATLEELSRINNKIEKLVNSMTKEDFEPATNPEDECIGCGNSRAVMQVSPCSHQVLCRLCFVKNIQQAVATRNLPLCCVLCKCKILRVKNNYMTASSNGRSSHSSGLPKSVSGYEVSSGGGRLRHSGSSYSVTSVSSGGSGRSVRSTGSNRSNSSWFSIDSLSSFQVSSFDRGLPQPRRHSISRKHRHGSDQSLETEPTTPTTPGAPPAQIPNSKSTPLLSCMNPSSPLIAFPDEEHSSHPGSRQDHCSRQIPKLSISMPEKLSDYQHQPQPEQHSPSYQQHQQQQLPQHHPPPPTLLLPGTRYRRHPSKDSQLARMKLKSPDLAETSFTMSTIEEEIEGVNISLTGAEQQNLPPTPLRSLPSPPSTTPGGEDRAFLAKEGGIEPQRACKNVKPDLVEM